ncbi:MAG: NAD(P)-dependent oxidoreductase [Pseudomonadota bacterium]
MRILITGAGGRLGRLLRAARTRDGTGSVQVLFQSRRPGADLIWSPDMPFDALPDCDAVVALWGVTGGTPEALSQNSALAEQSIAVAQACKAGTLVHLSSAAVYGPGVSMNEDTQPTPKTHYGQAKLAMEQLIAARAVPGVAQIAVRLSNVVGADSLLPALQRGQPAMLDRFANGMGPVRSYIGAADVLAVFCALVALPVTTLPRVMNIAAPQGVGMEDLVRAAGKDIVWRPAPATAIQEVTLDVTCMTRLLPHTRVRTRATDLIADWQQLETDG